MKAKSKYERSPMYLSSAKSAMDIRRAPPNASFTPPRGRTGVKKRTSEADVDAAIVADQSRRPLGDPAGLPAEMQAAVEPPEPGQTEKKPAAAKSTKAAKKKASLKTASNKESD